MGKFVERLKRLREPKHPDYLRLRRIVKDAPKLEYGESSVIDFDTLMYAASMQGLCIVEAADLEHKIEDDPRIYMCISTGWIDGFFAGCTYGKETLAKEQAS